MHADQFASRSRATVTVLFSLLLWGGVQAAAPDAPLTAVWNSQQLSLRLRGTNTVYSCAALKTRLAAILNALGVRSDMTLRCLGSAFASHLDIELQTHSPIAATPDNLAALTQFDAKRRLLAQLRGEQLPSSADIPRFNARWQRVALHRVRKLRLTPSDCELLRQMRDQLFAKLGIAVEQDGLSCQAGMATRIGPQLQVVALLPDVQEVRSSGAAPQAGQP